MENWVNDFLDQTENENLSTPEGQEDFRRVMGDFKSIEDGVYGGYNAKKMTGKPYKLPESIDKLDEATRAEFTTQARKVLGVESLTEDGLKEINWSKGLAAGSETNQAMIDEFGKFAVSKGLPKSVTQDMAEFLNGVQTKAMADFNQKTADAVRANTDRSKAMLESYFGTEGIKTHTELLRRAVKNQGGLSDAEAEQIADDLKDDVMMGKGVIAKVFMNFAAKLEKEGTTEQPGGNPPAQASQYGLDVIEDNPKTAAAVGWKK